MLNKIKSKGFTIIEVIIAIFVIVIGVGGAVVLINQTVGSTQTLSFKLVASYLAQEGIEIVKNIRDSNFLAIHKTGSGDWRDGLLPDCPTDDYEADYLSTSTLICYQDHFLKLDGSFYNYDSEETTPFKRKITITEDPTGFLEVVVEVSWQERGRTYTVTAQENLYQWWQ